MRFINRRWSRIAGNMAGIAAMAASVCVISMALVVLVPQVVQTELEHPSVKTTASQEQPVLEELANLHKHFLEIYDGKTAPTTATEQPPYEREDYAAGAEHMEPRAQAKPLAPLVVHPRYYPTVPVTPSALAKNDFPPLPVENKRTDYSPGYDEQLPGDLSVYSRRVPSLWVNTGVCV